MDALQRLQAFDATRQAGRTLRHDEGLPVQVREGASLCSYGWTGGELSSIIEPDGTRFDYHYGDDGRLLGVDRNHQAWARYGYDAGGQLISAERADACRAYDRDAQGQLTRTRRGAAGPWTYRWSGGRVAEALSDHECCAFDYDASGRPTGLVQRVDGVALSMRVEFDAEARLARIDFPEWGQQIGFTWGERGRAASISWNGQTVIRLGSDDTRQLAWSEGPDGLRSTTWHEPASGRPLAQTLVRGDQTIWHTQLERDEAFRLCREGERRHRYDAQGRLVESTEGDRVWRYHHDAADRVSADGDLRRVEHDAVGRVTLIASAVGERVIRYDEAGELESMLVNGDCVARCCYDTRAGWS
jgi:YD repeat-containing protein